MQGWNALPKCEREARSEWLAGQQPARRALRPAVRSRAELDTNDQAIAAAIFAVTVAYLWIFRRYTSLEPDEGIVLEGAQRILRGEVLYRDFFSYFTPGSYYFLALLFKIFGSSFLVARTALVFFGGDLFDCRLPFGAPGLFAHERDLCRRNRDAYHPRLSF